MNRSGTFVAIDGPNGVGKSTLIKAIAECTAKKGFHVHLTKEVTDSSLGRFIREEHKQYHGKTLAFLVAADRQNHIERDILPFLKKCDFVISDRYVPSSLVFQELDGVSQSFIWKINAEFLKPDFTIVVTASAETIADRLASRSSFDRFETSFRREQEVHFFDKAASFLKKKGYKIRAFKNEKITVAEAAERLSEAIIQVREQSAP